MPIERETAYQLVLAGGAVALFVAAAVYVSTAFGTNGNLTAEGGMALVGAIAALVVLLLFAGLWLERQEF